MILVLDIIAIVFIALGLPVAAIVTVAASMFFSFFVYLFVRLLVAAVAAENPPDK